DPHPMSHWNSESFLSRALEEPVEPVSSAAASHHGSKALASSAAPSTSQAAHGASEWADQEACYASLLGMAERFRVDGNYQLCLHCLKAALHCKLTDLQLAWTNLQIGRLLMQHAARSCQDKAAQHLEAAWKLRSLFATGSTDVADLLAACLHAADLLSDLYSSNEQLSGAFRLPQLLEEAARLSQHLPEWYGRFLLKQAQCLSSSDSSRACELLALGSQYAQQHGSEYARGLFLLAKCVPLLANRQLAEVHNTLTVASKLVDQMPHPRRQEALRTFSLLIQVLNSLVAGQAKQARPILRQLQRSVQSYSAMQEEAAAVAAAASGSSTASTSGYASVSAAADGSSGLELSEELEALGQLEWLSREQLSVLTYLLTLLHCMQEATYDKVRRYADKALMQLEKLRAVSDGTGGATTSLNNNISNRLFLALQLCIQEQLFQCRLVSGDRPGALSDLAACVRLSELCPVRGRAAHTRSMLALYSMCTNCLGAAESQFRRALAERPRSDLLHLVQLNLALLMLRQNRLNDCRSVLDEFRHPDPPHGLRAAGHWVRGLLAFMLGDFGQAKVYIRECLKLANMENLKRMLTCSLIVLGQIHFATGQYDEVKNVVDTAVQLADQMPDEAVQLWASTLMRDLYRAEGNSVLEASCAQQCSALLHKYQVSIEMATAQPEHQLVYWLEGPMPDLSAQPASMGATASYGSASGAVASGSGGGMIQPTAASLFSCLPMGAMLMGQAAPPSQQSGYD
ncbi:hypothetical protein BOX15_Mlig003484g1, partial [Macrostomum lignano]